MCIALGVVLLTDSNQLHDIPVKVPVRVEEGTGDYGDQNVIGRFPAPRPNERPGFNAAGASSEVPF